MPRRVAKHVCRNARAQRRQRKRRHHPEILAPRHAWSDRAVHQPDESAAHEADRIRPESGVDASTEHAENPSSTVQNIASPASQPTARPQEANRQQVHAAVRPAHRDQIADECQRLPDGGAQGHPAECAAEDPGESDPRARRGFRPTVQQRWLDRRGRVSHAAVVHVERQVVHPLGWVLHGSSPNLRRRRS